MTIGRAVSSVLMVCQDKAKLGRLWWTKLGGSVNTIYVMTMSMPHNKDNTDTKQQPVWDQHKIRYTSQGLVDREPCYAPSEDVVDKIFCGNRRIMS